MSGFSATCASTPWTPDGFRASWGKACKAASVVGVTFGDLRGTAVTRLALAGSTEAEIATITGHSMLGVRAILDTHYLARDPALGESTILKPLPERSRIVDGPALDAGAPLPHTDGSLNAWSRHSLRHAVYAILLQFGVHLRPTQSRGVVFFLGAFTVVSGRPCKQAVRPAWARPRRDERRCRAVRSITHRSTAHRCE
jgi:hypothetical protein